MDLQFRCVSCENITAILQELLEDGCQIVDIYPDALNPLWRIISYREPPVFPSYEA